MRNWQPPIRGILLALASLAFVLGGFSLSLLEGYINLPVPTVTLPPPARSTDTALPPLPSLSPLTPPAESSTPVPPTLTSTASLPPPPTDCPPPAGWIPYVVQSGDTLQSLAASSHVSTAELSQANCLLTASLLPGVVLYVPPRPTSTTVPCGPPAGWVVYIVRTGDTLYHLSQVYGVRVAELQQANCMGQSSVLHVGQKLYLPSGPTRTPTLTPTRSPTNPPASTGTPTRTSTATTPGLPASTPTPSYTPTPSTSPTSSATDMPTDTPTATATPTPSPTDTP